MSLLHLTLPLLLAIELASLASHAFVSPPSCLRQSIHYDGSIISPLHAKKKQSKPPQSVKDEQPPTSPFFFASVDTETSNSTSNAATGAIGTAAAVGGAVVLSEGAAGGGVAGAREFMIHDVCVCLQCFVFLKLFYA